MRLAVAARELETSRTGVARWLREILSAWRDAGRDRGVILYVERGLPEGFDAGSFEIRPVGRAPGGSATRWEQGLLARALTSDRPDAILCPANAIPLRAPVPSVVVLHDLSFEAHPEWFSAREGTRLRFLARWSCQRARRIVAVSPFTAREIERRYGLDRRRVRVVPNGVPKRFAPITDATRLDRTRRRHALGDAVVLAVGSVFQRRRLPEIAGGFARVVDRYPDAQLVVLGSNRTHPRIDFGRVFDELAITDRCRWLVEVDDDELLDLYSIARVCVYLSDYEGFGIPPLEAVACGSRVLSSDIPAIHDNLHGHATLLSAADHEPGAIGAALASLLAAPHDQRRRPEWLDNFSWPSAAAAVHDALVEAAGR